MRELKQQIQMMRRELESRIEDTDDRPDTPETPIDQEPPAKSPLILLPGAQEEEPPAKEYEQLKFDVSAGDLHYMCSGYTGGAKIKGSFVDSSQMRAINFVSSSSSSVLILLHGA